MKKYFIIFSALAFMGCNSSQQAEERGRDAANRENDIRQRAIDSMENVHENERSSRSVNNSGSTNNSSPSTTEHTQNNSTEPKKKGMSNTTKGALIGTGAGIATGAATGAAVSKDKGKGAIIGGVVGGAVGSGVGYGVGASKDKKNKDAEEGK